MSNPVINANYFTALTDQVNAVNSCAQLQAVATDAITSVNAALASTTTQLAVIEPMLALLTAPEANPAAIVTYIETLISAYLTPMLAPAVTLAAQVTAMTAAVVTLTAAIESKASQFTDCTITIPT